MVLDLHGSPFLYIEFPIKSKIHPDNGRCSKQLGDYYALQEERERWKVKLNWKDEKMIRVGVRVSVCQKAVFYFSGFTR